jgi:hypothetical protein
MPIAVTFKVATALALAAPAVLGTAISARAGGELVAFPEKYAGDVLYAIVDRPDIKQYRELYAPAAAIEAAKAGKPLPDGTVLTLVQYTALRDAAGNPQVNAQGRFIKGTRVGYAVMDKRAGWGADYPDTRILHSLRHCRSMRLRCMPSSKPCRILPTPIICLPTKSAPPSLTRFRPIPSPES